MHNSISGKVVVLLIMNCSVSFNFANKANFNCSLNFITVQLCESVHVKEQFSNSFKMKVVIMSTLHESCL